MEATRKQAQGMGIHQLYSWLEALLSNMEKGWLPEISKQVIIGHGDSLEVAKELRDMVASRFPEAELYIAPIGPVIGAHAGPGVMTVFFWGGNH